jgi:hypothetical protein
MIKTKLKNGSVITVSDVHLDNVHSRVLAIQSENLHEIYDIFQYPTCHWGEDRVAIVKRDFNLIVNGILPQYFISLWLTSEPKSEERDGSYLIVSFFADMKADQSFSELIEEHLPDLNEMYPYFCVDYDI